VAGYDCSLCSGEEQANILITPLTGGETMAVGEDCMSVAFTGMLAGHLGLDAEKLWAAIERLMKAAAKAEARQAEHQADTGPPEGPGPEAEDREGQLAEVGGDQ
jgi:hypothetical protein